jgi:hypothetical protein
MTDRRGLPEEYDVREFPVAKGHSVICGKCNKPKLPRDMIKHRGRRMCRECASDIIREEDQRKTSEAVEDSLRALIFKRLDLDRMAAAGEREPPDPTVALEAFYQQFGGSNEFGMMWAKVVKAAGDRAIEQGVGSVQAARMMLDVYRATAATHNAFQDRDIERMSLEEAQQARKQLIASEIAGMARDAVQGRLLDVIRTLMNEPGDQSIEEFLGEIETALKDAKSEILESPEPPRLADQRKEADSE